MPSLNPVSRRELVRKLKGLGFEGPFQGGKHQWMRRRGLRLTIPNPHGGAVDPALIRRKQARARRLACELHAGL